MPQNTPMKRQFITIDGRTVMSNLPQHWGGNDWKITGVDNPLPVGNYVQTEAGVWIPQKGSDDGAADVRLTGSNVEERVFFKDVTITPGSEMSTTIIQTDDFSKFTINVWRSGGSSGLRDNVKIYYRPYVWGQTMSLTDIASFVLEPAILGTGRILTEISDVLTERCMFTVQNNDTDDRVFSLSANFLKR